MIIAAYRPRDGFLRVIRSLDAQTLPQDEFETIVIDDGSPDDTFERLQRHAATRPNMRVRRIENSGWPSRPRNLAIEMARGDH
ncbi:MAG TPA: glycosyltransferase family A protein, partial [Amnibacterium sp.]